MLFGFGPGHDVAKLVASLVLQERIARLEATRGYAQPQRSGWGLRRLVHCHDQSWSLSATRRITPPARATRNDEPQHRVRQAILLDKRMPGLLEFFKRNGQTNSKEIKSTLKPCHVIRPSERFAINDSHRLEESISVSKTAVPHRDARFFLGNETSIQEDCHARRMCGAGGGGNS